MKHDLIDGETVIDTWLLYYLPPYGGKYSGKLTVTDRRVLYKASGDASVAGVLGNIGASGELDIGKQDIRNVEVQRSLFHKQAIVTLADGSRHVFDRGMMNVDKVAAAIGEGRL